MKPAKHIIWETVLILASVLIFRSLWLLLDSVVNFNSTNFLIISFIVGIAFAGFAIRRLTHSD